MATPVQGRRLPPSHCRQPRRVQGGGAEGGGRTAAAGLPRARAQALGGTGGERSGRPGGRQRPAADCLPQGGRSAQAGLAPGARQDRRKGAAAQPQALRTPRHRYQGARRSRLRQRGEPGRAAEGTCGGAAAGAGAGQGRGSAVRGADCTLACGGERAQVPERSAGGDRQAAGVALRPPSQAPPPLRRKRRPQRRGSHGGALPRQQGGHRPLRRPRRPRAAPDHAGDLQPRPPRANRQARGIPRVADGRKGEATRERERGVYSWDRWK
mmetsp:Transcript_2787/g.9834  ORF Transcript_2787/g.9834 Transcript_2787/m.9834 type:complete len:268 (+) Transcript_2787:1713-2516(+)